MLSKIEKFEPYVFYALLLVCLIPVWSVDYFVTGDGPCHLYNSKILLDWGEAANREFYKPYYYLNTNFEPNWLFNLITVPLLYLFHPERAEQVFMTIYVLGFGLGFRYLIGKINPAAKFLSYLGLVFCYHKLLMMGFFNNSLSLVMWFWVAGWWWAHRDDQRISTLIKLTFLILLLFSAHPMGFTYAGVMMAMMLAGLFILDSRKQGFRESAGLLLSRTKRLAISALPSLILFAEFVFRQNWSSEKKAHDIKGTLESVARLMSLRTMDTTERDLALATAITCTVFFLGAVYLRLRERRWLATDGLILFLAFVMYCLIYPPNSFSGGLEVSFRMGMIPYFGMLFWAATANFPVWSKLIAQLTAIILIFSFLEVRLPIHLNASDYAKEIRSCGPYINDRSSLLTLNYDWNGRTAEGKEIVNALWMFTHVDCYLGTDRSMVISDNYETHFFYFPIISRWNTDMYGQTDKAGMNFDNRPPRADILSYGQRTRAKEIDYVVMICYRDEFKDHEYTKEIMDQLNKAYDLVYSSEHKRALLYKRRGI